MSNCIRVQTGRLARRAAIAAGMFGALGSSVAAAQSMPSAGVSVSVRREDGSPVNGATVIVQRAGVGALYIGTTDDLGAYTVRFAADSGQYAVVARKIGLIPVTTPVRVVSGVIDSIIVTLQSSTVALDTVRVVADAARQGAYLLRASNIASSSRTVYDAFDAMSKLQPDMLGDRGRNCQTAQNLWINGTRVFFLHHAVSAVRVTQPSLAAPGTNAAQTGRIAPRAASGSAAPTIKDYLRSVKSEDIAEIRYVNCWDTSMPDVGTNDAIYITLKPGVSWDLKNGSHPSAIPSP